MNSPRDLRRRIRSIRGTAQITRAMQMVAASKMRRAQQAALDSAAFARRLYRMQRVATARIKTFHHPWLEVRPVRNRAVILVATDKGLCGALNTNVFRMASQLDATPTVFITAGRKAAQFVARSGRKLAAFAQFGSELDAATQAKIDRGKRIVELFKQAQYNPVPVEVQVAVIWAVQNGYVDDVPVERIKEFQAEWTEFLTIRKTDLLERIGREKALATDLVDALKAAADQFKQTWK